MYCFGSRSLACELEMGSMELLEVEAKSETHHGGLPMEVDFSVFFG